MNIDWTSVTSSNIDALCHEGHENRLFVRFNNGRIYEYLNVDQEVAAEIRSSASVGSAFNRLIKSRADAYPCRRLN